MHQNCPGGLDVIARISHAPLSKRSMPYSNLSIICGADSAVYSVVQVLKTYKKGLYLQVKYKVRNFAQDAVK
jgi:hypothetical protein